MNNNLCYKSDHCLKTLLKHLCGFLIFATFYTVWCLLSDVKCLYLLYFFTFNMLKLFCNFQILCILN